MSSSLSTQEVVSSNSISPVGHSQHVIREQPVYIDNGYRYRPYQPAPSLDRSSEFYSSSSLPQNRSHTAHYQQIQQQHLEQQGFPSIVQHHNGSAQSRPYGHPLRGRQRRTHACVNCHNKKLKCEGDGSKCRNCIRMDIECKWVPTKKRGPKPRNKRLVETAAAETDAYSASLDSVATAAETQSLEIDIDIDNQNAPAESDLTNELLCLDKSELPNIMSESYARMLEDSSEIGVFINPLRDRSIITNSGESQERIFQRFFSDEIPEETRETVMYYFDYFYSICPIFHPAMFVRRLVEGKVESILLEAMRASAARIIMKKTGKTIDVDKLINQIYKRLILYVDRPTVDYVRTVVLMASLNGGEGNFLMYNSLTYLAVSLVTRLGWNAIDLENPEKHASSWEEWVMTEIKRRIFWTTYQIDCYQSLLSDRPMSIGGQHIYVLSPGSDAVWDNVNIPRSNNWPVHFDPFEGKETILKEAKAMHPFVDLCNLTAIITQETRFISDFKVSIRSTCMANGLGPVAEFMQKPDSFPINIRSTVKSLFEYSEFREVHHNLCRWRNELMRAEELKEYWKPSFSFTEFGCHDHRLHWIRVRYFCLYAYFMPLLHILHMTNRPSFFSPDTADPSAQPKYSGSMEHSVIRELMEGVFSGTLNDGFLAYDVVQESWDICVDSVYDYVTFLDKNTDIPYERYDQIIPFGLFTSITVLIRHTRVCRQKIEQINGSVGKSGHDLRNLREELLKSIRALRRLWSLLLDLGAVWKVNGMEALLRIMEVEEMTNAADMLSELVL
ncbi:hypothetical protein H4217_005158 [Coemansia sp. RSA 1939]|nr:hypothetical protein H4217_005158 [Coemansia sp. RSA 1939]KAJ2611894.1 hypothetical protein EV177_003262 [Coemansia sp. RSA 1804]